MRVFKGYMKITKRNLGVILLYFAVFVFITLLIQSSTAKKDTSSFTKNSMKITVVDRDGGELAEGLKDYLAEGNELVELKDDKDTLRDALYYRETEFIIYVPAHFEEACLRGNEKLGITAVPGSYTESYMSYQVDTYLNHIKIYQASGYDLTEAVQKAVELQKVQPEVSLQKGSNAEFAGYMYGFRYFPYLFLSALCCAIGMLLVLFRADDVRERIQCAPVSPARRTGEMVLALSVIGVVLWLVSLLIPIAQSGGKVLQDPHLMYLLLNSFLLLLVSMGIAIVVGTLIKRAQLITNVATTVSLGISFLCGVFVPLSIMGSGVKKVTQVMPVFWYETINELLGNYKTLTGSMRATIYKGYVIQIAFAIACVCVAMVISKLQEQKR